MALPQVVTPEGPEILSRQLSELEHSGVATAWTLDQVQGPAPTFEPLALIGFMAAHTSRLNFGIAVLVGAARSPLNLAKSLATVDHLCAGRLIVGLGLGDLGAYAGYGHADGRSGPILDAIVDLLPRLWSGEPVTASFGPYRLDGAVIAPAPLQRPHPPLWFGGRSDAALDRVVRGGSGWVGAGLSSAAEFATDVGRLRERLAHADRRGVEVAKRLYVHVTDGAPEAAAREQVRGWFATFYGDAARAEVATVIGPPQACVEAVQELYDDGADHVMLHPVVDREGQQRMLMDRVLPDLITESTSRS